MVLPKDNQINRPESGRIALLYYAIDYEHWEFRQETDEDRGRDCVLEYIDENSRSNCIIQSQVKGIKMPEYYLLKEILEIHLGNLFAKNEKDRIELD